MNYDELKKIGTEVEVTDALNAPLLSFNIKGATTENVIEVTVKNNENKKIRKTRYNLQKTLKDAGDKKDEFIIEPVFKGDKVSMEATVIRRLEEKEIESKIELGDNLSGKTLILNFPNILGTYANYYDGLIVSEKYMILETFSEDVNAIILKNRSTNKVIETLYSSVGNTNQTNLKNITLPNDFGIVSKVIEEENLFGKPIQYIKVSKTQLVELTESIKEKVPYEPIILFDGYNKIETNTGKVIEITYPKKTDLMKYFLGTTFTFGLNNEDNFLTLDDLYFKDSFTKIEDNVINALFNKLTINCLNSKNNNFSLDCDGNLTVNSITTKVKHENESALTYDKIYPVGSVYHTVTNTNPNAIFGGTWQKIKSQIIDTKWQNFSWTNKNYMGTSQSSYTPNKWRVKDNILYIHVGAGTPNQINTADELEVARIPIKGNNSYADAYKRVWTGAIGGVGAVYGYTVKQNPEFISVILKSHTSDVLPIARWTSTHFTIPLDEEFVFTSGTYDTETTWKRVA